MLTGLQEWLWDLRIANVFIRQEPVQMNTEVDIDEQTDT